MKNQSTIQKKVVVSKDMEVKNIITYLGKIVLCLGYDCFVFFKEKDCSN